MNFSYLCDAEPALSSLVQQMWDRVQAEQLPFNLVLCGSSVAFMGELLAERNPLHGRQTLSLDLAPLNYREAGGYFTDWPLAERVKAYAIFGGMPYYLSLCDPAVDLAENVLNVILQALQPFITLKSGLAVALCPKSLVRLICIYRPLNLSYDAIYARSCGPNL